MGASMLVDYDFESGASASTNAAGITGGGFSSNGLNLVQRYDRSGDANMGSQVFAAQSFQAQGTVGGTQDYFEFSISADAGKSFSVESLVFDSVYWKQSGQTYHAIGTYQLASSADNYTTVLGTFNQDQHWDLASPAGQNKYTSSAIWKNMTFDLWGTNLDGQEFSDLTFRLYVSCTNATNSSKSSGRRTGFDNMTVMGAVVPEPSSSALLGLGGLALALRRRK